MNNCGVVSWQEGEKWQITVYDAGFQTPECIKGKVFYQIFPDRFCEGIENKPMPFPDRLYQADKHAEPFWQPNETGGHLNEDYFGGDLEGIRIKLPYLREMGVDVPADVYTIPYAVKTILAAKARRDAGETLVLPRNENTQEGGAAGC